MTAALAALLWTPSVVLAQPVWICGGQSNMVVGRISLAARAAEPDVHLLSPVGTTCWAFGVHRHHQTGEPIWLVQAATGGSSIYQWLAPSAGADPSVVDLLQRRRLGWGGLFQRKIAPLIGTIEIAGVVWWQGESDTLRPLDYGRLLRALIRSWRQAWGVTMPFAFVQLPTGGGMTIAQEPAPLPETIPVASYWGTMRAAYGAGLEEPMTAMVGSLDLPGGLHPRNRAIYGKRLAEATLGLTGPTYAGITVEGGALRIHFRQGTADGLLSIGPLQGFQIAGADGQFVWADAVIDGETVLVSSPDVPSPTAVRYAWAIRPRWANLFNGAGIATGVFSANK